MVLLVLLSVVTVVCHEEVCDVVSNMAMAGHCFVVVVRPFRQLGLR